MTEEAVSSGGAQAPTTEAEPVRAGEVAGGKPVDELAAEAIAGVDGDQEASDISEAAAIEAEAEESVGDEEVIAQLRQELAVARVERDEHLDKLQRTAAEFQNARRRQEKQLADAIDRANATLILRLLPVLDDFELAFQNAPQPVVEDGVDGDGTGDDGDGDDALQADQAWVEGFRQIQKKLLDLLASEGVTPVDASGEFDPTRHEAVLSEESDEVESGHILEVLRGGYEYKGQVLRPAMVRVAA